MLTEWGQSGAAQPLFNRGWLHAAVLRGSSIPPRTL